MQATLQCNPLIVKELRNNAANGTKKQREYRGDVYTYGRRRIDIYLRVFATFAKRRTRGSETSSGDRYGVCYRGRAGRGERAGGEGVGGGW